MQKNFWSIATGRYCGPSDPGSTSYGGLPLNTWSRRIFFCLLHTRHHENPASFQIKRPYFHVKELETTQLKNWREYLDFEIAEGDEERIRVLFERSLIACALYDTMWLKVRLVCTEYSQKPLQYARWALKKKGSSSARNIYERARIHCPKSINICLAYSALEESKGTVFFYIFGPICLEYSQEMVKNRFTTVLSSKNPPERRLFVIL